MRIELPLADLCAGCGKCCESIGLPPFEVANPEFGAVPVSRPDCPERFGQMVFDTQLFMDMPAELRKEHAKLVRRSWRRKPLGACAWWDGATKRCRHYEWRPAVCRDWQPNDTGCLYAKAGRWVTWRTWWTIRGEWKNPRRPQRRWMRWETKGCDLLFVTGMRLWRWWWRRVQGAL